MGIRQCASVKLSSYFSMRYCEKLPLLRNRFDSTEPMIYISKVRANTTQSLDELDIQLSLLYC